MMHPKVKQALEEIDAAVFNGDTFEDANNRAELMGTIARWQRELGAEAPDSVADDQLRARYAAEICAIAEDLDPRDELDWHDMALGFFMGCGATPERAARLARDAHVLEVAP